MSIRLWETCLSLVPHKVSQVIKGAGGSQVGMEEKSPVPAYQESARISTNATIGQLPLIRQFNILGVSYAITELVAQCQ